MAWQDRHYYRDRDHTAWTPLSWMMYGSVPLFTALGIRVRAHSTLIVYAALTLILGFGYKGFTSADRVQYVSMLFLIVLLHEFGHCFAARWVGGHAEDILMHPLGGLAMAHPPRRPLPTFITVAGGPAVNVLICLVAGSLYWIIAGQLPSLNPFRPTPVPFGRLSLSTWGDPLRYAYWTYYTSYTLLAFNLMPIFPLDGGQMTQSILWPWMGYYRSMLLSCVVGMVAAVLGAMVALANANVGLAVLAAMGFMMCLNLRRQLLAMGPEEYASDEGDYSAAYEPATPQRRRKRTSRAARRAVAQARRSALEARLESERLDTILAKVSAHGIASLTWRERRALRHATEKRRKRDIELSR